MELERILGERTNVHDSLMKKENIAANLESDKKKLLEDLKKVWVVKCVKSFNLRNFRSKMRN